MVENDLFEAIRREDVVIFAGAGFSGYAGYPLGSSLGKELFDALLPGEQTEELKALPLDYLAEQIVRIRHGSRDLINQVLDDVFGAPPTSNKDHELLASIPHFKTIITTNYDRLFENAYGEAATLIFREQDVTKWKEGGVNIIKIHGDLSDKASVILTRNDYSRFYRTDYSSPFWASITKDIATKTILFLGYGYEDPNVWAIFERVYEHIGDKRKAAYFIGPNVDAVKVSYLEAKGIEYMNRTGGDFLSALMKHIEDHIFSDIEQRWVSSETFWKFTRSRNLEVPLRDSTSGLRVVSINGMDGQQMNGHIKFTINPESDFPERHKAFFEKNKAKELILGKNELNNFRMDVEGLKLFGNGDLNQISITKIPKEFPYDLAFVKEGLEIRNLLAKVYATRKHVRIETKIHTLNFEFNFDLEKPDDIDGKWKMDHDQIYHTVAEEVEVHRFLKYFFSQSTVTIYLKGGGQFSKQCPIFDAERINDAENYLAYFNGLKDVEKAFGISFRDFYGIDQESTDDLNWLLKVIWGEKIPKGDTMSLEFGELSPEILDKLPYLKDSEHPFEVIMNSDLMMLLHDQKLPVNGLRIEVPNPDIININDLKNGSHKMEVLSRSGTIYHHYQIEPFEVNPY